MAGRSHLRCTATWLLCLLASSAPILTRAQTTHQPAPPHFEPTSYVGQYTRTTDPDIRMSVYREDGHLYEEREGRPRRELIPNPTTHDRFDIPNLPLHLLFTRNGAGQISACRILANADNHIVEVETRISSAETRLSHYRPYTRTEAMIPMRDGAHLHTVILEPAPTPDHSSEPFPFLIQRTPYGVEDNISESINQSKPELAASGYIFVFQDIRGRYKSEGKFVMNRPIVPHLTPTAIDETTDTYDTVAWLLKNIPNNNARAGVLGVSYDGFLAMMAGISPHPAVKAISPQAPMTDVWLGDDFFHNGAFRQAYAFDYVQQMEAQKTDAVVNMKQDTFDFFLKQGNFANAASTAKIAELPTAEAFLTQPTYTKFWQDMAVQTHLAQVTVPTLEVGGFWDQEDMYGTQAEYAAMAGHNPNLFLVLGPWNHGGWEYPARKLSSNLGSLDFGEPTGTEYRKLFEAPFFEKFLKDRPGFDLTNTATFRTGANRWQRYNTWPPTSGVTPVRLYLEPNHTLCLTAPTLQTNPVAATYISDPADPVPYRHRPVQSSYAPGSGWYTWLIQDQSFTTSRPDVATFFLPTLDYDLTFTGEVTADLFVSTSGTDGDWIVKLIDVSPDQPMEQTSESATAPTAGYQLMVASEIFRGRYRTSFEHPAPLTPNAPTEFLYSLHAVDHTFLKGHRILVQIQSTWFPLYDRNPQTYVPNIMSAAASAYKPETITIYASPTYPSHLELQTTQ